MCVTLCLPLMLECLTKTCMFLPAFIVGYQRQIGTVCCTCNSQMNFIQSTC